MEVQDVYQLILSLAKQLSEGKSKFTRADLAFELKKYGVDNDSLYVSELTWGAYNYFQEDEAIASVFMSNDGKHSLVDEYKTHSLAQKKDKADLFTVLDEKNDRSICLLNDLNSQISDSETLLKVKDLSKISNSASGELAEKLQGVFNFVSGRKGILKVQDEAQLYFDSYKELMNLYDDTKSDIRSLINDFVTLRGEVNRIFTEYSSKLVDIFGDSIKVVDPSLFDFETIEWIDINSLLKRVELEYTKLSGSCSLLLEDISRGFLEAANNSVSTYNKYKKDSKIGLAFVGLAMLEHYFDVADKTNIMKQELVTFKRLMNRDMSEIKGDYARLLVIFKTINELYIPKAHVFFKNAKTVLNEQMDRITHAIYEQPQIKALNGDRNQVLRDIQMQEASITDAQLNLDYYNTHIDECSLMLKSHEENYENAKSSKPVKPSFILNLLTLGYSKRKFSHEMYQWNGRYSGVIRAYENLVFEINLDKKEVFNLTNIQRLGKNELRKQKKELIRLNNIIKGQVILDDSVRLTLLKELKPILKSLSIAKDIMNAKLNDNLLETIKLKDYGSSESAIGSNLLVDDFISKFSTNLYINTSTSTEILSSLSENPEQLTESASKDFTELHHKVVDKAIYALNSWGHLHRMRKESRIEKVHYDNQVEEIQRHFNAEIAHLNQESDVLARMIHDINTSKDYESLKKSLLNLSEIESPISSDQELLKLLKGELSIEI